MNQFDFGPAKGQINEIIGIPNGLAGLNNEGKVIDDQLPNVVQFARQIETDDAQSSYGTFVTRITGGDASLSDGDAWLNIIRGNIVHNGYSPRYLTMSVTPVMTLPRTGTITAIVNRNTFVSAVTESGTYSFDYVYDWNAIIAKYGITVTGTPVKGDNITIIYVKADAQQGITESIITTVNAMTTVDRENPIVASINEEEFDNAIQSDGTTVFEYTTDWNLNPASYGIAVTNSPVNGDKITVNCIKEVRGKIEVFDPDEFYSTNWNLYNHDLGYARTLKYRTPASFIVGGTFTSLKFSETNDPSAVKLPIPLVDMGDGMYYFEVAKNGFVWLEGANNTDTYILMTWTDWTNGLPEGTVFSPHVSSTIDLSTLMAERFPYGLMRVGNVADEIDISLQTAYSRIERKAWSMANLELVKASGRAYEYDENYIYVVKAEADTYAITLDGMYTANDHGLEVFTGTFVPGYAEMLYGQNLVDKLRTDVLTISQQNLSSEQKAQVWNNLDINSLGNRIGDLTDLTTTEKTNVVEAVNEINANLGNVAYLPSTVIQNRANFTSWTITVVNSAGAGLLMGFAEVWAFSYASTDSIGAVQIARGMRNQGDRGFTFAYNSTTKKITITTTNTVWGGATIILA